MNVAFIDLNNGSKVLDLEGSLVIPHMDGPDLGPINDEVQAKQLKRENFIKGHHKHNWL
jgi:hypothetical protein